jgi:hypothetical protein
VLIAFTCIGRGKSFQVDDDLAGRRWFSSSCVVRDRMRDSETELLTTRPVAAAREDNHPMEPVEQEFGKPNPNAPAALPRFAFLIGGWRCETRVRSANGEWQTLQATWLGRFILDGYAIEDEYRMTGSSGELIVLGMNFRTYDAAKQIWNIKWLNALAGTWLDLGTEELGGVTFDGQYLVGANDAPGLGDLGP